MLKTIDSRLLDGVFQRAVDAWAPSYNGDVAGAAPFRMAECFFIGCGVFLATDFVVNVAGRPVLEWLQNLLMVLPLLILAALNCTAAERMRRLLEPGWDNPHRAMMFRSRMLFLFLLLVGIASEIGLGVSAGFAQFVTLQTVLMQGVMLTYWAGLNFTACRVPVPSPPPPPSYPANPWIMP